MASTWTRPRYPGLRVSCHSPQSPRVFWAASSVSILQSEARYVTAVYPITGEYLGRRMTCCLISPLFLAGFLCTALAPDIYLLYTGRILGGLALGLGSPPAGVLVSEVATPAWRTTFGGGLSAFYMVGMVITFILGKVTSLSLSLCHW